ncbi:MAG TPA: hypothetical protein VGG51_13100 [Candidatus Cybelea sp.]|jgi:hypothetical protein
MMRRPIILALLAVWFLAAAVPALAQTSAPTSATDIAKSRLETMLRNGHADPAWFSAEFLAQIPASKIDDVIANLKSSLGAFEKVEVVQTKFVAYFAKGTDDVTIQLDGDNKIALLLFKPPALSAC